MACASACGQPSIVARHDVAAYHRFALREIGLRLFSAAFGTSRPEC